VQNMTAHAAAAGLRQLLLCYAAVLPPKHAAGLLHARAECMSCCTCLLLQQLLCSYRKSAATSLLAYDLCEERLPLLHQVCPSSCLYRVQATTSSCYDSLQVAGLHATCCSLHCNQDLLHCCCCCCCCGRCATYGCKNTCRHKHA
jgi:hypothetical protein